MLILYKGDTKAVQQMLQKIIISVFAIAQRAALCWSIAAFNPISLTATAQSTPPAGVNIPPNIPEQIETIPKPPEPLPQTEIPSSAPTSPLQTPSNQQPPQQQPSPTTRKFPIKEIKVKGNTVLQTEINKKIKTFQDKYEGEYTFENLIELRTEITQLYLDNNYVTSGAFIFFDSEEFKQGIVTIQVAEGKLEGIEILGLNRLREGYVRSRLQIATKAPLNKKRLEEALQLLQIDPLLEQVDAQLTAGRAPGLNILQVTLKEAPAFNGGIIIANNQSPSVGSIQGSVYTSYNNPLGVGDKFTAEYGLTDGLNLYGLGYSVPVNARNGSLSLRYSNNNSKIIESDFEELGIRSDSESFSIAFRQPFMQTVEREFGIGIGFDVRRSQTYILDDIPFSFSQGPEDGQSRVAVIRFSQDWVQRDAKKVLAARSQFSLGIDAFDATVNDSGIDGRFFSWLGQFQWVQQLSPKTLMLARLNTQLTPDSLLSLEKLSLGGVDTVRGYRQNQLVSDNGVLASVEFRLPLSSKLKTVQLTPFFEIGGGWNNRAENPDPGIIASLGTGLRWQVTPDLNLSLDYGIPLIGVKDKGNSLQDNGFYFSLNYQPFR
ncbi:ShlB/FhaC/HecB family hemolysin secretion/activation protein [Calothrix sp. CCY 0018]|uniref:ShlB/FhaC/HecB family hemolysin secretion/activation protein n=1 Tax=Calothrix sp. CCY 0018 TaxID=3103864 RepID=UPI0039C5CC07